MATQTETLIYEIRVDDNGAAKTFDAWDRKLSGIGSSFKSFGSIADTAFNVAFTAFNKTFDAFAKITKNAVTDSIKLEDAMAGVRKTAGLTDDQIQSLQKQVRNYAVEELHGMVAAEDLAAALEIAGQQGVFAGKSFEQGSSDALAFAKVMTIAGDVFGGLNVESAAEQLGLLHGRFSDSIPDIERAASVINFFGDNTKRSEGFILNLAGRLAETANTVGLTEQATLALAATLGDLNQGAEKSGTAMSRVLQVMRRDSTKFAEVFGLDAKEFNRLVREDMSGAIVMFAKHLQTLGTSQEGIDVILQGMQDMQLTGSGVSAVLQGLGASADTLQQRLKEADEQWELNTSAMNSFIDGSDRVSKLWGALNTIFKNTIGLISDALLPYMKDVLKGVNETALGFREWFLNSGFLETTLPKFLDEIYAKLRTTGEYLLANWPEIWGDIKIHISDLWNYAKSFYASLTDPVTFSMLKDAFVDAFTAIKNLLGEISFEDVVSGVKTTVQVIAGITNAITIGYQQIVSAANFWGETIVDVEYKLSAFRDGLQNLWEDLKTGAAEAWAYFTDPIKNAGTWWGETIDFMTVKFAEFINFVKNKVDEMVQKIQAIPNTIKSAFATIGSNDVTNANVTATGETTAQGMISALQALQAENFDALNNTPKLKEAYRSLYQTLASEADKSIVVNENLQGQFQNLQTELRNIEDVGWKNSVFPDLRDQVQMSTDMVQGLGNSIMNVSQQLSDILPKLQQFSAANAQGGISSSAAAAIQNYNLRKEYAEALRQFTAQTADQYGNISATRFESRLVKDNPELLSLFKQFGTSMPAVFDNGGIVGGNGHVPAILQTGEQVLSRSQVQAGGANVTNNYNISGQVIDRQAFQAFVREISQEQKRQGALRV